MATSDAWPPARIKALRARLGFTLGELADRLGVRLTSVQKWCFPETASGYKKPSLTIAILLEQLEQEAKVNNPMNIDLLTARQREGKSRGGIKGTATRYGRQRQS